MLRDFFGNLIFAIIARMLCGNHLNTMVVSDIPLQMPSDAWRLTQCNNLTSRCLTQRN